jgi:epoxyqueuosine reductase
VLISGDKIKTKALELGFAFCGFAKATALEEDYAFFINYLKKKRNASLDYLEREPEKRTDPRKVFEGAQTVIGLLMNYFPGETLATEDNFVISKYGYGRDYHEVLKAKTALLVQYMTEEWGPARAKAYVDSGPVLEKAWAQQCGLGWRGKNTILINPSRGSFHFIAIVITDLQIQPDSPETDHCGHCHLCMDACPTGALEAPYILNPAKCISYLTIKEKAEISRELLDKFQDRIYGCDTCQDVCPFNRFALPNTTPEFALSERLKKMRKKDWFQMTRDEFELLFKDSAVHRTGFEKLKRNISSFAGNSN